MSDTSSSMTFTDSIVAIATPVGLGGICIVRLSGTKSLQIAKLITKKPTFTPRYATLSSLYDEGAEVFDEAIIIYYQAPKSYTCEDVIEFQCHGGDLIGQKVVSLCLLYGARIATPGEFTKRAFLNGLIDFSQLNAISQIIHAKDSFFQKALALQLKGELGVFVRESRESLLQILAYCEVMIDYSEEDIPLDTIDRIRTKLQELQHKMQKIYDFSLMRQNINAGWNLCIIGKPNVGKSSLLNAILLFDRAITSPMPGTTRDTIEEEIIINGAIVRLIDTAGIRESDNIIEQEGIKKSLQSLKQSNIVLFVLDISKPFSNEDEEICRHISDTQKTLIVLNKTDKEHKLNKAKLKHIIPKDTTIIEVSALQKDKTAQTIKQALSKIIDSTRIQGEIILSASYQLESMRQTLQSLRLAQLKLDTLELELFAYHIKDAIASIGQITKPYATSEMLDVMFSSFCLGK